MRDSGTEASLHSICKPNPGAPRVSGGFTPLSMGGVRPLDVPLEGIDCPWKYRNGLSELRPAVRALAQSWCNFRKAPAQGSNAPLKPEEFVAMREGLSANVAALINLVIESGACCDPATCAICKAVLRRAWMQGFHKDGPVGATDWCPTHYQPYGALFHALLIPRYSWVFGHVVCKSCNFLSLHCFSIFFDDLSRPGSKHPGPPSPPDWSSSPILPSPSRPPLEIDLRPYHPNLP
jgi:hypothetical protein